MLARQCETWDGPIAAALYMPMLNSKLVALDPELAKWNGSDVVDLLLDVQAWHAGMEKRGKPGGSTVAAAAQAAGASHAHWLS